MISFKNVTKKYRDGTIAVDNLSLEIDQGDFIAIIGTSGSGKTTTMRMINRMEELSSGEILINGKNIKDINPVQLRRKIGYVIQSTGLMPHMTIYENIVMVPSLLKWSEEKMRKTALDLIKLADMPEEYLDRYPSELSGGQQQRIGVIRALAANQKIILMDEPFGALDPITRETLQELVKDIQKKFNTTIVFVTHDMDEAFDLADKIAILDHGKLIQYDTPKNILSNPANDFVESLLGEDRIFGNNRQLETIGEIMYKDPVYAYTDTTVRDAVKIMRENKMDYLFVTDKEDVLKGVVNVSLVKKYKMQDSELGEFMDTKFLKLREEDHIEDYARRILKNSHKDIPVVNREGKLTGTLLRSSLIDIIYDCVWSNEKSEGLLVEPDILEELNKKTSEEIPDSGPIDKIVSKAEVN